MRLTNRLAFRLFCVIVVVMLVGTVVFTRITINRLSEQHLHDVIQGASRVGDVIKRSTNYSMLLNRREDIYHIINTIGHEPGIEAIRIYNKKGVITYSTADDEVGRTVDMGAEACTACHTSGKPPASTNSTQLTRVFASPKGYRVLGLIIPIYNDPSCATASCHAHEGGRTVLGVLDVMMPLRDLDATLAEMEHVQNLNGLAMVAIMVIVSGAFILIVINAPVRRLTTGTQEIMKGNLSYRIPVHSNDEIGRLAASFNSMSEALERARGELTEAARTLEDRVASKTEELRRAQVNMVQMEKMVSLGKLAATVAHELNNPLEGVLTYAKLLKRRIASGEISETEATEIRSELSMIADETSRCGTIVKNLLLFSRQKIGDFADEDLREVVERSLHLIDHHLHMHNISLKKDLPTEAVTTFCDTQQIEQALLAVEINAVDAMPEGGRLDVSLKRRGETHVDITISDTGIGIPDTVLPHIFEPFFTTKENGKGTGLGLAVVYGIVERHGGTIAVASRPREGTTLTITLPRRTPASGGS